MNSSSIENISVIDAKIESKILEVHERCMEDILNKIDDKFEGETKKNKYLFSQLNKKYKQLEEETKKINEKMNDNDLQSEMLDYLNDSTAYEMRKLKRDNIEQGKFNQEISNKVSMIDDSTKEFYGRLGDFLENFEKKVLESMNHRFDGLERKIATEMKEISNRIDEVEKNIIKTKDSLELTFCVNKTETDQKLEIITALLQNNQPRIDSNSERIAIIDQKCLSFEKTFDGLSEVLKQPR